MENLFISVQFAIKLENSHYVGELKSAFFGWWFDQQSYKKLFILEQFPIKEYYMVKFE